MSKLANTDAVAVQRRLEQQLLNAVHEAIIVCDLRGDVTYWNAGAERLYGWTAEEALGRRPADLTVAEPSEHDPGEYLSRVLASGPLTAEIVMLHRAGRRFPALVTDRALCDEAGAPIGIIRSSTDISERDDLLRSERAARRELELALQELAERQANLRRVIDSNIVGVVFGVGDGIIDANQEFLRLIGYSLSELQDESFSLDRVRSPRFREADRTAFDKCLAEDLCAPYETQYLAKDGSTVFVMQGLALLRREPFRWVAVVLDTTDRKDAEDRQRFLSQAGRTLAASLDLEATFQNVVASPVPEFADFCVLDILEESGNVVRVAGTHADPAKSGIVQGDQRLIPENDGERLVMRALEAGSPQLLEEIPLDSHEAFSDNPQLRERLRILAPRSALALPLIARGKTVGVLTLCYAESRRHYAERDLQLADDLARRAALAIDNSLLYRDAHQTAERLRAANRIKDEFLGLVSHELRTPITTIFGNAQIMRRIDRQLGTSERETILSDMEQETMRLQRLIDNMLVLSRIETGHHAILEPTLVQHTVRRVVDLHRRRFPDRQVAVELPKDLPAAAAEPTYFEQVIQNLITNAEKYSPPGRPIEVNGRREDGRIVVSVLDRGPGIDAGELDNVFTPFYRLDKTAEHASGAGLGLAVCKRLAEAQRGSIWAWNRDGGGSGFSFAIPIDEEAI